MQIRNDVGRRDIVLFVHNRIAAEPICPPIILVIPP